MCDRKACSLNLSNGIYIALMFIKVKLHWMSIEMNLDLGFRSGYCSQSCQWSTCGEFFLIYWQLLPVNTYILKMLTEKKIGTTGNVKGNMEGVCPLPNKNEFKNKVMVLIKKVWQQQQRTSIDVWPTKLRIQLDMMVKTTLSGLVKKKSRCAVCKGALQLNVA